MKNLLRKFSGIAAGTLLAATVLTAFLPSHAFADSPMETHTCTNTGFHYVVTGFDPSGDDVICDKYFLGGGYEWYVMESVKISNTNFISSDLAINKIFIQNSRGYMEPCSGMNIMTPSPSIDENSSSVSSSEQHSSCDHHYEYEILTQPTEEENGRAGYVCSKCGHISEVYVISRAEAIVSNRYEQIDQAKTGQTIKLNMGDWNSFSQSFMKKIADKSQNGVSFLIDYNYDNQKYEVSIPAGTAVDTTSATWYGPAYMMELYSTTKNW